VGEDLNEGATEGTIEGGKVYNGDDTVKGQTSGLTVGADTGT